MEISYPCPRCKAPAFRGICDRCGPHDHVPSLKATIAALEKERDELRAFIRDMDWNALPTYWGDKAQALLAKYNK